MNQNIVTTKLHGGLGNMLFQIGAIYSYAASCFRKPLFVLKNNKSAQGKTLNEYTSNILSRVNFTEHDLQTKKITHSFTYEPIPEIFESINVSIEGTYFQSEKYLNKKIVTELFAISPEIEGFILTKYPDIRNRTSIHVRRGDYLLFSHIHTNLSVEKYYSKALELFPSETFAVFSDDIEWCKNNLQLSNVIYVKEEDYIELYAMSLCKNNIIANSTFSWWGAYLNNNPLKIVVAPSDWFQSKYDSSDIIPKSWISLPRKTIGAFYQCYKDKKATEYVLSGFRHHHPDAPIILVSDGGDDFSDLASKYNCQYFWKENIPCKQSLIYEMEYFKVWWKRFNEFVNMLDTDYVIFLEDDVDVRKPISLEKLKYDVNGLAESFYTLDTINPLYRKICNNQITIGAQGGAIFKISFLKTLFNSPKINELFRAYDWIISRSRLKISWPTDVLLSVLTLAHNGTMGEWDGYGRTFDADYPVKVKEDRLEVLHLYKTHYTNQNWRNHLPPRYTEVPYTRNF